MTAPAGDAPPFRSVHISAPDGLRLHARDWGPRGATALPVACLPGLARTAADFDALAAVLASNGPRPRRVLALDYRGRGLSERDPDWRRYDVRIEAADTLAVLDALGVRRAVFVGTSRGGLIAMALAALRPTIIAGVVLNDIGPVIEPAGLLRIRAYVGKLPQPRDWNDAVSILQGIADGQFPRLSDDDWRAQAHGIWHDEDGRLVTSYDPALTKGLEALDLEQPLPDLWRYYDNLPPVPLLALRGANSDILSAETLATMVARRPGATGHTVPHQGHAPLLRDHDTIARIAAFIEACEAQTR